MKNQRTKTKARNFGFGKLAIMLLMLATLICCFTVFASAAESTTVIRVDPEIVQFSGIKETDGIYTMVYGETAGVSVTITDEQYTAMGFDLADKDKVTLKASISETLADKPVGTHPVTVSFELAFANGVDATAQQAYKEKYGVSAASSLEYQVEITKRVLTWKEGFEGFDMSFVYDYANRKDSYTQIVSAEQLAVVLANIENIVEADKAGFTVSASPAIFYNIPGAGTHVKAGSFTVGIGTAEIANNYTFADNTVSVNAVVAPIEITGFTVGEYSVVWGEKLEIVIWATASDGNQYQLKVVMDPTDNGDAKGTEAYYFTLESPDAANLVFNCDQYGYSLRHPYYITAKEFTGLTFEDVEVIGNERDVYTPVVVGSTVPADILAQVKYTVNGSAFAGTAKYGIYTVKAELPTSKNYKFVDANGQPLTTMTATLTVKREYIVAPDTTGEKPYQIFLYGENGFAGDGVSATVSTPTLARKPLSGFRYHAEYTLSIKGGAGETFTAVIPHAPNLFNINCDALTVNDIYVYDTVANEMKKASEAGYKITLGDGYYEIEGVKGNAEVSFVVAPVYNPPFFVTAPGISLIVLAALALIALFIVVGLYLKRVRLSEENAVLTVDTEGEVPEVVPVIIPDKVDVDESMAQIIDGVADKLYDEVEAEKVEIDVDAEAEEAVADSMKELMDSVNAIELEKEPEVEEETDVAEEMLESVVAELEEAVEAETEETEVDEDALREAVDEAIAENFNESADAADAIVLVADEPVEEEEEDDLSPEEFKSVVDAIVSDAMCATMQIVEIVVDESTEAEETAEAVEEAVEEVAEEAVEEAVEEATEEVAEEVAEEVTEEVAEEATEDVAAEAEPDEDGIVIEELSGEDICAIVADSVAEAFDMVSVDGVVPAAVEGTTLETITEAVDHAAQENVPEAWTADMTDAVKAAVVDELAARLLVEAAEEPEAVEAFAEVAEEPVAEETDDDDDDNDDDEDDGDSLAEFGSMSLTFIDVMAEPEKYQEMLEQEARGEVRLVTRYRRSFQSRLIQSQGNVQDYYSVLKNAFLSYKGIKSRVSWNYEAFNRGRVHVAKMNAKTKTLYLYLALDPEALVDTKYGIVDMSSKKKYATVPVLMKIKGDRKFKYALELVDKLCGEDLILPKVKNFEELDYRIPYQTTEELVQSGVVKKLVASVPVVYSDLPVVETPAEATPASAAAEAQEISFVAPADDPAVVAATEETAAEETPVEALEEAPVVEETEEVPAVAETEENTNTEI